MNNFEIILNWVDNLMFNEIRKNFLEVQKEILKGIWEGKIYGEIVKEFYCSEFKVKEKVVKLLKKFCKDLGLDFNKFNFCYKVEKKYCVF